MKRVGGVIVGCLLAAVVALGVLLGVTYTENARLKGDFSYLYVEPTVGVLDCIALEPCAQEQAQSGMLYLNTENVTQTACDELIAQMTFYASQYGLTLDACTEEEAREKGYIGDAQSGGNAVCVTVGDTRVDEHTILMSAALVIGDRGAHIGEMVLQWDGTSWRIESRGGSIV